MGQMTLALLVGTEVPAYLEKQIVDLTKAWRESAPERGFGGSECVESPYEAGRFLIGFYAAVGAGGTRDVPDFLERAIPFASLVTTAPFQASIAYAEKKWQAFAAFAQESGVKLGPMELWITPTEVA